MTGLLRFCVAPPLMNRSRTLFALLVVALVATFAAPASAKTDPATQRQQVRAKKAKLAAQLNTLTASESQLLAAAKDLADEAGAQAKDVAAARAAFDAVDAELADANTQLAATKGSLDRLTHSVVQRAVDEYIAPQQTDVTPSGDTTDLAERARRQALLSSVTATDADIIDQLNAAKQDYDAKAKEAADLRAKALERKKNEEDQLNALQEAEANKARLAAAVDARKDEVLREIDAMSKADADLSRIISQRGSTGSDTGSRARDCIWPANGTVTSEYGMRWGRLHAGIDIANHVGTAIWAAKSGQVIFVGSESGYGLTVIVDHGGGMSTLYAHMSRFATSDGASVHQGQLIGYIGQTGDATGPHVHFETRYGGSPRNPRGCLP